MTNDGKSKRAWWVARLCAKEGTSFDEQMHHKSNGDPRDGEVEIISKINTSGHEL